MKLTKLTTLLVLGMALALVGPGCRKRPGYMTDIPPGKTPKAGDIGTEPIPGEPKPDNDKLKEPVPLVDPDAFAKYTPNAEIFKDKIVYFDFDSSVVKTPEQSKVAAVADYLKANAADALRVEGHCDERGTEEYNRALGERRALAVREQLIGLGIPATHIITETFGKDRPAEPGHNEAAWKKNRRGEFILLTPPAKTAVP